MGIELRKNKNEPRHSYCRYETAVRSAFVTIRRSKSATAHDAAAASKERSNSYGNFMPLKLHQRQVDRVGGGVFRVGQRGVGDFDLEKLDTDESLVRSGGRDRPGCGLRPIRE